MKTNNKKAMAGKSERLVFILLPAVIAITLLSIPAMAETNITLLYGWNGTAWVPLKVSSDGTLQTDLNLTEAIQITPKADNTYDLGASSFRWRDLFVARNAYLATASGSVGIGTSTPLSTLDVSGNLSVSGSTNSSIDGSTLFIDATNNRVGIGTTSPASALDLNAGIISNIGNAATDFDSSGGLTLAGNLIVSGGWANVTSLNVSSGLIVTPSGNVGIGTAAPTELLMVAGNIAPSANNTYDLANSTHRWRNIWAYGNITAGDLLFSNNFRFTEISSGISLKDNNDSTLITLTDNSIESSKPFRVSLNSNAPFVCDSTKEGYIYFDKTSKAFKGCNGSVWVMLG